MIGNDGRSFQNKTNVWIMLQSPPEAQKMGFFQDKTMRGDPFRSTKNALLLLSEGQTGSHCLSLVKLCLFHLFAAMDPVISSEPEEELDHWRLFLAFSITSLKHGSSLSSETLCLSQSPLNPDI